jgi:hypothetical protein
MEQHFTIQIIYFCYPIHFILNVLFTDNVFTNDTNELKAPGFERHKKFFDYHNLKMQATQGI